MACFEASSHTFLSTPISRIQVQGDPSGLRLCWVESFFGYSTVCQILLGQMETWQDSWVLGNMEEHLKSKFAREGHSFRHQGLSFLGFCASARRFKRNTISSGRQ